MVEYNVRFIGSSKCLKRNQIGPLCVGLGGGGGTNGGEGGMVCSGGRVGRFQKENFEDIFF